MTLDFSNILLEMLYSLTQLIKIKPRRVLLIFSLIIISSSIVVFVNYKSKKSTVQKSNYEIYSKQAIAPQLYYKNKVASQDQPIGEWTGRLILPPSAQRQPGGAVLFEVHNAPSEYEQLIGKTVNLNWSSEEQVQEIVRSVTQDVTFTAETEDSKKAGKVHPDRLNNLKRVGPLESLAGARPQDDVIVKLKNPGVEIGNNRSRPRLIVDSQPVQITGSIYSLVRIIKREGNSDRFLVRHYNKTSNSFDGDSEIIRIPQVPTDREGIARSTTRNIEKSPLNTSGWYVYGVRKDGVFEVQAIAPRAVLVEVDQTRTGKSAIAYINQELWKNTQSLKGTAKVVLLDPTNASLKQREGDQAIVIHTFGGIGGKKAESTPLGVVTGHFSFGIAEVVREPLTDQLRWDIEYWQVYAHNPDGIVAGAIHWSSYMGDLERGWQFNRPIADILVKFDPITQDYNFDGIQLSPLAELTAQLNRMTARYRIGDGTGSAVVSPAESCVQDSNQALYATIQRIEEQVEFNPRIQDWLRRHPDDPQTRRFQELVKLGRSLEQELSPLGLVRSDWRDNAQLSGATNDHPITTFLKGITTWRTMMPRRAQDELATILLKHGATLLVIRTNQVGGFDPDITPRAPTALLGHR